MMSIPSCDGATQTEVKKMYFLELNAGYSLLCNQNTNNNQVKKKKKKNLYE